MKIRPIFFPFTAFIILLFIACVKDNKDNTTNSNNQFDTLEVAHSMKGWEIYSWPEGNTWYYSIQLGTNRIKTYMEVTSNQPTYEHLITVIGTDSLKLVLNKFPENEFITWIGKGWLQNCWGGNYGNLQLPPQNYIDEIILFCDQKNLNLQITD